MCKRSYIFWNKEESKSKINQLYWNKGCSALETAKRLGIPAGTIGYLMRKLDIPRRTLSEVHKREWANPEIRKKKLEAYKHRNKDFLNSKEWREGQREHGFQAGHIPWNKDLTKETDERIKKSSVKVSKANEEFWSKPENREMYLDAREGTYHSGAENHNWLGGLSFEPYGPDFNEKLKRLVRDRDEHTCQSCGEPENGRALDVHHIDYDKKNNIENNLISLCLSCHMKTNINRDYWPSYFEGLI